MSTTVTAATVTSRSVPDDVLRERVGLYLTVLVGLDILFYVWSGISIIVGIEAQATYVMPSWIRFTRWGMTASMIGAWAYVRWMAPGRMALHGLESVGTVVLLLSQIFVSHQFPSYGAAFSILFVSLLLVLRAAVVPSSVSRTIAVAVVPIGFDLALGLFRDAEEPLILSWLTVMGVAFAAVSAVTSHVIYGLRRQVSEAKRLGQYELSRKIGEGGMGIVYEATHVMLRRPTAIKLLPASKAGETTVQRFEREVRQTSRLEHPNSVYIYDYGRTPDGQFYYAMELLDGLTLAQLVEREGPLPPARVLDLLQQAARALSEAHDLGLVHRDIKPANIMLCRRGGEPDAVKVLDFGLVKSVDSGDAELTQANAIVGTPHYLSPEAIRRPDGAGPASDVYALGAVGFFLLTGRNVFEGETVIDICAKHLSEEPESPAAVRGSAIDPALERLVLDCLRKDPSARPTDGATLLTALESLAIDGWTRTDAARWWDEFDASGDVPTPSPQTQRTQLEIDVGCRT